MYVYILSAAQIQQSLLLIKSNKIENFAWKILYIYTVNFDILYQEMNKITPTGLGSSIYAFLKSKQILVSKQDRILEHKKIQTTYVVNKFDLNLVKGQGQSQLLHLTTKIKHAKHKWWWYITDARYIMSKTDMHCPEECVCQVWSLYVSHFKSYCQWQCKVEYRHTIGNNMCFSK